MAGTRTIALVCISGSAISLLLSISTGSALFAFLCALLLTLSLLIWKYGYAIMPSFFLALGAKEKIGDLQIPETQDALIKKTSSGYLATMFVGAKLEPGTQSQAHPQNFSRAISQVRSPCKFSILVYNPDTSRVLDELRSKRSSAENKRSQIMPDPKNHAKLAVLDREIAMWSGQIERISSGEKPMQTLSFVSTSARGDSLEEALSRVRMQARDIQSGISQALSAETSILRGEEMKKCFEWEHAVPQSSQEVFEETA